VLGLVCRVCNLEVIPDVDMVGTMVCPVCRLLRWEQTKSNDVGIVTLKRPAGDS